MNNPENEPKICKFRDGWAGIVEALTEAKPGDHLEIESGVYPGSVPLSISSGVTLRGQSDVVLQWEGAGTCLNLSGAEKVLLSGLTVKGGGQVDNAKDAVPDNPVEFLTITDSIDISISLCEFENAGPWMTGVLVARSERVEFDRVIASKCLVGISILNSRKTNVAGGRFFENDWFGIVYTSSSGKVRGNEVWGNGEYGIGIGRDQNSVDSESTVDVRENRIHDNRKNGIIFASSSGKVRGNELWGNGESGIGIVRDLLSVDSESTVDVRENRIHDNEGHGIGFLSSSGEVDGNHLWNNGANDVAFLQRQLEPPSAEGVRIESRGPNILRHFTSPPDDFKRARKTFFESRPTAWLNSQLGSIEDSCVHNLSEFLASGCLGCFESFWGVEARQLKKGAVTLPQPDSAGVRCYTVASMAGGPIEFVRQFADEKSSADLSENEAKVVPFSLEQQFECFVEDWLQKGSVTWHVALVSADCERVSAFCQWVRDHAQARAQAIAKRRKRDDLSIGRIQVFSLDLTGLTESEAEDAEVLKRIYERLLEGRSRWREQIEVIPATGFLFLVFFALLLFGFWAGNLIGLTPSSLVSLNPDNLGEVFSLLKARWSALPINEQGLHGLFAVVAVVIWFVTLNLFLPRPLHLNVPFVSRVWGLFLSHTTGAWSGLWDWITHSNLGRRFERFLEWTETRARIRWFRDRFFGPEFQPPALTVIALRNVDFVPTADAAMLRELSHTLGPNQGGMVVTEMTGLSNILGSYLNVWLGTSEPSSATATTTATTRDVFRLLYDPRSSALVPATEASVGPREDSLATLGSVLGYPLEECREYSNALEDPGWTPGDLLPALVLGSAPMVQMRVSKKNSPEATQFQSLWKNEVAPYAALFAGNDDDDISDPVSIERAFKHAYESLGILSELKRDGRPLAEFVHLIGRPGYRVALTQAIRGSFLSPDQAEAYLERLAASGEWFNLNCIITRLQEEKVLGQGRWLRLPVHMEAAGFLLRDRFRLGLGTALATLDESWATLSQLLHEGPLPQGISGKDMNQRAAMARLYCGFLAAVSVLDERRSDNQQLPGLLDQFDKLVGSHWRSEPATIRECFVEEVNRLKRRLIGIDPQTSEMLLQERFRQDWAALPELFRDRIRSWCVDDRGAFLMREIAGAADAIELLQVVEPFVRRPVGVVMVLSLLAGAYFREQKESGKPGLVSVGKSLLRLKEAIAESTDQLPEITWPADLARDSGHVVAPLMCDEGFVSDLIRILVSGLDARQKLNDAVKALPRIEIEGLALGTHSAVNRQLEELEEVRLVREVNEEV